MENERYGTRIITGRDGLRRVDCLCDCGRESNHSRRHLLAGKVKKCECESAVVGFMGVLLGNWRNDRKFKCIVCHQWSPLYFESAEKGVCGGSHGQNIHQK